MPVPAPEDPTFSSGLDDSWHGKPESRGRNTSGPKEAVPQPVSVPTAATRGNDSVGTAPGSLREPGPEQAPCHCQLTHNTLDKEDGSAKARPEPISEDGSHKQGVWVMGDPRGPRPPLRQ